MPEVGAIETLKLYFGLCPNPVIKDKLLKCRELYNYEFDLSRITK
jgi:hypothetical protein